MQQFDLTLEKDFVQTHAVVGCKAFDKFDQKRYIMVLLNNILGGSGMSSRLNLAIREKYGYVYTIGSTYSTHTDIGVFSVYLGTDDAYLNRAVKLIYKEFNKLRKEELTKRQLQKVRNQLLGNVAMLEENHAVLMQSQAKSLLDYDRVITLDEFFSQIEKVTAEQIQATANATLTEENMSLLIYKPKENGIFK